MYMCTLYREPKGILAPYYRARYGVYRVVYRVYGIWYIGWFERWTNGLDLMLGMMVESLTICDGKSVHRGVNKACIEVRVFVMKIV